MPEIYLPEKIIFGKNKIADFCPDRCEHALLISDSDVFQNRGFLNAVERKSKRMISQVSTIVNQNITELYNSSAEIFFSEEVDLIIAAGSAAVIDCGMLLSHESGAKFTAIPCSSACAMTNFENEEYYSYRHSPNTLILDPALIECMPSGTVAYDGMACFSYAIDTIKSSDNIITKSLAIQGAVGILKNLIPAYRGDIAALERMMYSMYFAVAAHRNGADLQNSALSKVGKFFSEFGFPVSSICALVIPNIMEAEEEAMRGGLFEIAKAVGIANSDDDPIFANIKLIDEIRKIQASVGIPRAVSGFGLNEKDYHTRKSSTSVPDDLLDLCYYGSFKFMKL